MLSSIKFIDLKKSKEFSYAADIDFFKANKSIEFNPGLNILYGSNGSGKSTILRMAALALAAEQGGASVVTDSWLQKIRIFGKGSEYISSMKGIDILHDGQPILYGNPRNAVGIIGGSFDDDFFEQGILDSTSRSSTGYKTLERLNRIFSVILGDSEFPKEIIHKVKIDNDRGKLAIDLLKSKIAIGQKTILLDEPESGIAISGQLNIFEKIARAAKAKNLQIIIATHSVFSLGLLDANYIEMKQGCLSSMMDCLEHLHLRIKIKDAIENVDNGIESGSVDASDKSVKSSKVRSAKMDKLQEDEIGKVVSSKKSPAARLARKSIKD